MNLKTVYSSKMWYYQKAERIQFKVHSVYAKYSTIQVHAVYARYSTIQSTFNKCILQKYRRTSDTSKSQISCDFIRLQLFIAVRQQCYILKLTRSKSWDHDIYTNYINKYLQRKRDKVKDMQKQMHNIFSELHAESFLSCHGFLQKYCFPAWCNSFWDMHQPV